MPTIHWAAEDASWGGSPAGWGGVDPPPTPDSVRLSLAGDTVALDDTAAGFVATSIDLGWPAVRVVTNDRAQVDGALDTTARFGARGVTIALAAIDSDLGTWKAALARLSRFLAAGSRPTLSLVIDGVTYTMTLAPDVAAAPFEFPNHARAQLAFRAPDPFLYSAAHEELSLAAKPSTLGRVYPWTVPRIYPVSDAVSGFFEIDNAGAVDTWPTVEILGPMIGAAFTLENTTTGDRFAMTTSTIDDGHRLVIDMLERTVRYDADPTLPRFSLIDFTTSRWVRLVPGVNVLRFATDVATTALATVRWSDPFLWPGGLAA